MTSCVLDTHILLDFWVFEAPEALPLLRQIEAGHLHWLTTAAMRDELERVLGYPQMVARLQSRGRPAAEVMAAFDRWARPQAEAPRAPYRCKDPDDQKFIDLAVQHQCTLHSRDRQILCMKNRLLRCNVTLNPALP